MGLPLIYFCKRGGNSHKLKNREIYVELFFGYVLKNERDNKGIDDLLTNTLKGKEEDLLKDINTVKNEKHLTGQ